MHVSQVMASSPSPQPRPISTRAQLVPARAAPPSPAPLPQRRRLCARAEMQQTQKQLPASLQKIVGTFQIVPDPMARYKQLLFYAQKLPPMAAEYHVPENKVEGCVSQVRSHNTM